MSRGTDAERARLQAVAFGRTATPEEEEIARAAQRALLGVDEESAPPEPVPAPEVRPRAGLHRWLVPLGCLVVGGLIGAVVTMGIAGVSGSAKTAESPTSAPSPIQPVVGTGTIPGNPDAAETWFQRASAGATLGFDVSGVDEATARLVDSRSRGVSLWLARTRFDPGYCFIATRNVSSEAAPHAEAACVTRAQFLAGGLAIDFIGGRATWNGSTVSLVLNGES